MKQKSRLSSTGPHTSGATAQRFSSTLAFSGVRYRRASVWNA
jgi:hypothetical protein